jgi:hypothetical protein
MYKKEVDRGYSRESFSFLPLLSRLCLEEAKDERICGGIVNPTRPKQTATTVRIKPNECVLSCTAQRSGLLKHCSCIFKSGGKRVIKRGIVQVRLRRQCQPDIWFLRWDVGWRGASRVSVLIGCTAKRGLKVLEGLGISRNCVRNRPAKWWTDSKGAVFRGSTWRFHTGVAASHSRGQEVASEDEHLF